jgi:hypothetical protein
MTLPSFRAIGIARRVAQTKQHRRRAEQKFTRTVNLHGRWHHNISATPPAQLAAIKEVACPACRLPFLPCRGIADESAVRHE